MHASRPISAKLYDGNGRIFHANVHLSGLVVFMPKYISCPPELFPPYIPPHERAEDKIVGGNIGVHMIEGRKSLPYGYRPPQVTVSRKDTTEH